MATVTYLALILSALFAVSLARVPLRCFIEDDRPFKEFGKALFEHALEIPKNNQPELGKLILKDFVVDQDGLFFQAKSFQVLGLENAIVDDIGMNLNSNLSRVTFHTDMLIRGLYKAGGSLFAVPIEGEGECEIDHRNIQVEAVFPFEIIQDESGKRFINLKSYKYWYDIKGGSMRFDNLFGGNKELSDAMHYLINQNFKLITFLYGKKSRDQIVKHLFNVFKSSLLRMPLRQSC